MTVTAPLLRPPRRDRLERVGRLQGQRDIPINAKGRAQARRCGETLRELLARDASEPAQLDFVASPLGRTRETMEIVRARCGSIRPATGSMRG